MRLKKLLSLRKQTVEQQPHIEEQEKKLRVLRPNKQLVWGYVPQERADEMALLAVFSGDSRSKIVCTLITAKLEGEDIDKITNMLADRIYKGWRQHWHQKGEQAVTFKEYRIQTRKELFAKKVSELHVNEIMTKARKLYEAHKAQPK